MSVSSKIKVGSLIAYRGYLSVLCLHVPYTHKLVSATFIVHYFTTAIYFCIWLSPAWGNFEHCEAEAATN